MKKVWQVVFSRNAAKQYEKLKKSGSKRPNIIDVIDLLAIELAHSGPCLLSWPNFGLLGQHDFHCHLTRGRPTYVACWRIKNLRPFEIEVYYVGTHENAPY